jgi:SSS family solute:Na+ symporter
VEFQSAIALPDFLYVIDYVIIIGSLVLTFGAGVLASRRVRSKTNEFVEYMLMGRQLTLPFFTATLVATWYGGIFGVTEIAFKYGVYNFITQGVFWYITYIIFALFLVDKVRRYEAVTLPEMVTKMYGPRAGKVAAIFNFFNVVPVAYIISLGLFSQLLFGVSFVTGCIVGTLFVCIYSVGGGFRADVYTDTVQFFIMCSSVAAVALIAFFTFGGVGFLTERLPADHFSVTGGNNPTSLVVWGLIALSTLVDPTFYQRCFAAKDVQTARWGILISTLVWFLFDICTTLGGMYARALVPAADPQQSYVVFAIQMLPPGIRGFFLAGILATVLSTVGSYLFIGSTTATYDLAPKSWRGSLAIQRTGLVVIGIFSIVLSIAFEGSVKEAWKVMGSYFAGCLLLPLTIGHFLPRFISEWTFIASTATSVAAISIWKVLPRTGIWADVDDLFVGLFASALVILASKVVIRKAQS